MKKILKIALLILLLIAILIGVFLFIKHEPRPNGVSGPEAELLAKKILKAVDKPAWDSTKYVSWTFRGEHHYLWDKQNNEVQVKWDDVLVNLDHNKIKGEAYQAKQLLQGEASDELIKKAWSYFCNDSFWLNAFTKIYDPGTERSLVTMADGRKGLMVTYKSGGVTPGDSYLWFTDENGLPTSYKMWVKIIPTGGVEFSWEDWTKLSTGAMVAQNHKSSLLNVDLSNIKAGQSPRDVGILMDDFKILN